LTSWEPVSFSGRTSLLIYSLIYFLVLLQSVPAPSFWTDYLFCTLAYNSKQFRVLSTEILSRPSTSCPKFSVTLLLELNVSSLNWIFFVLFYLIKKQPATDYKNISLFEYFLYLCTTVLYIFWFCVLIHTEKSNKMQQCIKIYYSIFIWSSTCLGLHTAHHQEPKTALAASGFAYVEGCWTCGCWTLTASSNHTSNDLPRMQTRGC
jgi:hypothetical protein